jgi:hypothetical protein
VSLSILMSLLVLFLVAATFSSKDLLTSTLTAEFAGIPKLSTGKKKTIFAQRMRMKFTPTEFTEILYPYFSIANFNRLKSSQTSDFIKLSGLEDVYVRIFGLYKSLQLLNSPVSFLKIHKKAIEEFLFLIGKYVHNSTVPQKEEEFFNRANNLLKKIPDLHWILDDLSKLFDITLVTNSLTGKETLIIPSTNVVFQHTTENDALLSEFLKENIGPYLRSDISQITLRMSGYQNQPFTLSSAFGVISMLKRMRNNPFTQNIIKNFPGDLKRKSISYTRKYIHLTFDKNFGYQKIIENKKIFDMCIELGKFQYESIVLSQLAMDKMIDIFQDTRIKTSHEYNIIFEYLRLIFNPESSSWTLLNDDDLPILEGMEYQDRYDSLVEILESASIIAKNDPRLTGYFAEPLHYILNLARYDRIENTENIRAIVLTLSAQVPPASAKNTVHELSQLLRRAKVILSDMFGREFLDAVKPDYNSWRIYID